MRVEKGTKMKIKWMVLEKTFIMFCSIIQLSAFPLNIIFCLECFNLEIYMLVKKQRLELDIEQLNWLKNWAVE